jgi:hypothetical protein
MNLNKYIYDIRGALRNYHNVDDDPLTDRQIEFWIISQRATWAERRDRTFMTSDHSLMQTIIDEIIAVDRSFVANNVPAGYKILRTEERLPKPINFKSWDGIISCGPIDMAARRFNHCSYDEAVASGYGRFNKNQIYSFYHNGHIYLISRSESNYWKLITKIAITGIWQDPREVGNFSHLNGEPCWTKEMDYPLSLDLWSYMKEEIRKANVDSLMQIPVDKGPDKAGSPY